MASRLTPQAMGVPRFEDLAVPLARSLAYVQSKPANGRAASVDGVDITWGRLARTIQQLMLALPELQANPTVLAERFEWCEVAPKPLLTGYFEPTLKASLSPGAGYVCPIYAPPNKRGPRGGRTAFDRREIDLGGALTGKGLELAWCDDAFAVYQLHVQGSGRLVLPDGTTKRALYATGNGRRYVSLGRILADRGYIDLKDVTMPAIADILAQRPDEARTLMAENPSYVFFHLADDGPYGAMGAELTPFVSLAVDRRLVPLGAILALDGEVPDITCPAPTGQVQETLPMTALVLAQDTGGAIRGARADLFCGAGEDAEALSGRLKHPARLAMLLSRE